MSDGVHHILQVPNSTAHLATVREIVREVVARSEYKDKKDAAVIVLAVDEAMANIMEHAYRDDYDGRRVIELELSAGRDCVQIVLRDQGTTFDPNAAPMPDLRKHVREGHKHGLGLYLMRSVMDDVQYSTQNGWNELRMKRHPHGGGSTKS